MENILVVQWVMNSMHVCKDNFNFVVLAPRAAARRFKPEHDE